MSELHAGRHDALHAGNNNTAYQQRTSLLYWLLVVCGLTTVASLDTCGKIPFASGTCAGLGRLYGDKPETLEADRALAMVRLRDLAAMMPQLWSTCGGSVKRPELTAAVLAVQLCQWKRGGWKTSCDDLRIAMSA